MKPPFLKKISIVSDHIQNVLFPFSSIKYLSRCDFEIKFKTTVTFFVGENGTGKSTVLEAIAELCGFHRGGGSQDHRLYTAPDKDDSALSRALRPSWLPKVTNGFFFRSETFADLAEYIDSVGDLGGYGGRTLHGQSHGESFLSVFKHRLGGKRRSIILMDEPEAALSPMRQLSFLVLLKELEDCGNVQIIIVTHSPIIMSYPYGTICLFTEDGVSECKAEDTEHYRVTRSFLRDPHLMFNRLFDPDGKE